MFSSCDNTKEKRLAISSYVETSDVPKGLNWPTHIGFFNDLEIISDAGNNRLLIDHKVLLIIIAYRLWP
jgi:hypothetical protein